MDPEIQIKRARRIEAELPETEAAFAKVREDLLAAMIDSPLGDSAGREYLFLSIRALDAVLRLLNARVTDGLAAENIVKLMSQPKVNNG